MKYKNILLYTLLNLSLITTAYAADVYDLTLVEVFKNVLTNFRPIYTLISIIAFATGLFLIGQAGIKLKSLGANQQIRGAGIVSRFIAGGVLVGLISFAGVFASLFHETPSMDAYREQMIKDLGSTQKNKINDCINGGDCKNY